MDYRKSGCFQFVRFPAHPEIFKKIRVEKGESAPHKQCWTGFKSTVFTFDLFSESRFEPDAVRLQTSNVC